MNSRSPSDTPTRTGAPSSRAVSVMALNATSWETFEQWWDRLKQLRALAQQNRELQGDLTQIREAFGEQLERVNARFHLLAAREQELREMLLDAHEQLLRRDEEIQAVLAKDGVSAPLPAV